MNFSEIVFDNTDSRTLLLSKNAAVLTEKSSSLRKFFFPKNNKSAYNNFDVIERAMECLGLRICKDEFQKSLSSSVSPNLISFFVGACGHYCVFNSYEQVIYKLLNCFVESSNGIQRFFERGFEKLLSENMEEVTSEPLFEIQNLTCLISLEYRSKKTPQTVGNVRNVSTQQSNREKLMCYAYYRNSDSEKWNRFNRTGHMENFCTTENLLKHLCNNKRVVNIFYETSDATEFRFSIQRLPQFMLLDSYMKGRHSQVQTGPFSSSEMSGYLIYNVDFHPTQLFSSYDMIAALCNTFCDRYSQGLMVTAWDIKKFERWIFTSTSLNKIDLLHSPQFIGIIFNVLAALGDFGIVTEERKRFDFTWLMSRWDRIIVFDSASATGWIIFNVTSSTGRPFSNVYDCEYDMVQYSRNGKATVNTGLAWGQLQQFIRQSSTDRVSDSESYYVVYQPSSQPNFSTLKHIFSYLNQNVRTTRFYGVMLDTFFLHQQHDTVTWQEFLSAIGAYFMDHYNIWSQFIQSSIIRCSDAQPISIFLPIVKEHGLAGFTYAQLAEDNYAMVHTNMSMFDDLARTFIRFIMKKKRWILILDGIGTFFICHSANSITISVFMHATKTSADLQAVLPFSGFDTVTSEELGLLAFGFAFKPGFMLGSVDPSEISAAVPGEGLHWWTIDTSLYNV